MSVISRDFDLIKHLVRTHDPDVWAYIQNLEVKEGTRYLLNMCDEPLPHGNDLMIDIHKRLLKAYVRELVARGVDIFQGMDIKFKSEPSPWWKFGGPS